MVAKKTKLLLNTPKSVDEVRGSARNALSAQRSMMLPLNHKVVAYSVDEAEALVRTCTLTSISERRGRDEIGDRLVVRYSNNTEKRGTEMGTRVAVLMTGYLTKNKTLLKLGS